MILYQLACGNGHQFEAWFRDGATYDEQSADGDIQCPFCNTTRVSKAPMAPNVATGAGEKDSAKGADVTDQVLQAVATVTKHLEENCEFVGEDFAEEARRIHYGETDERDIYGEATEQETAELDDEEIPYWRIPAIPRRDN
jgi:hypothetical protein